MKQLTLIITSILISGFTHAQLKSKTADTYFEAESYSKAAPMYAELVKKSQKKNQVDIQQVRRAAQSYLRIYQYNEAVKYYAILENSRGLEENDYIDYIQALRTLKRYPKATELTTLGQTIFRENKTLTRWSEQQSTLPTLYSNIATNQVVETTVNSGKGDFSPVLFQDGILFATRALQKGFLVGKYAWDQTNFINILYAKNNGDDSQFEKPKRMKDVFFSRLHDGPVAFDSTGNQMILTRNDVSKKNGKDYVRLALYLSTKNGDGSWSEPTPLPFNSALYNVGHATFAADQKGIYFVSDMPGGFGGTDLYYSEIVNGEFQRPVNLGDEINTELNEMFPFVSGENVLYFSSNGHYGLGGLDVFKIKLGEKGQLVSNLGFPINSSADDFALITDKTNQNGYFTSGRENFIDRIYAWSGTQAFKQNYLYALLGNILDEKSNSPLEGATIQLQMKGKKEEFTTNPSGKYVSELLDGLNFGDEIDVVMNVKKPGYAPQTLLIDKTLGEKTELQYDFHLTPFEVGQDLGKVLKLKPIYYDLDKHFLRDESKGELDKVIAILNENPTMMIELSSHTDCRQSHDYNIKLSERRAQSAGDYIKKRIKNSYRVISKGYGELKMVNDCHCDGDEISNCSEEEHQKNRRTEFIILQ